jgi:hypothetical protein
MMELLDTQNYVTRILDDIYWLVHHHQARQQYLLAVHTNMSLFNELSQFESHTGGVLFSFFVVAVVVVDNGHYYFDLEKRHF